MECQYCHKILSSISSLNLHQKRTKYCLEKQGKSLSTEYCCVYCKQDFTSKYSLQLHYITCINMKIIQN